MLSNRNAIEIALRRCAIERVDVRRRPGQDHISVDATRARQFRHFLDGDHSFTALIRCGQDAAASGRLDGVILAGWRTGARVHVEFERHIPIGPTDFACGDDAPMGTVCFEGTMQIGSASKN